MTRELKTTGVHAEQSGPTYQLRVNAGSERKKILVAISGGLNSAVAAALFKSQGHEVIGVHFQVYDSKAPKEARFGSRCCLTKDQNAAKGVCAKLDIPFHMEHLEDEFEAKVVDYFVHELVRGHLPNACLPCNKEIRFGALFRKADELGCELVATGHHAQVFRDAATDPATAQARLLKAVDLTKDQSYFLFGLSQKQLLRIVMPVGGFQDSMILRLAREFELPEITPPGQQEVCLIKGGEYKAFFESRVPISLRPGGNIRDAQGTVLGEHKGLYGYQIGQKVQLAPSLKDAARYEVIGYDVPGHALIMGERPERLFDEVRAGRINWIRPMDSLRGLSCRAKLSPSQREEIPCRVTQFENATVRVAFEQPQEGLIAGQAIVFYEGDEVLGGAYIEKTGRLPHEP